MNNHCAIVWVVSSALVLAPSLHADSVDEPSTRAQSTSTIVSKRAPVCATTLDETPLRESMASAGLMFNLAEHPKSIRAVAQKLLTEAIDSPASKQSICAPGCSGSASPEIVYRVAPTAFLPPPEQQAQCVSLERDTQQHPLTFAPREFDNVGALNSWMTEFSQGRGSEGQRLYAQCGGNCSPRYTFFITSGETGLKVGTEVICGLARDREVDDYKVSTALRSTCRPSDAPLARKTAKR